jgi:hypothetical protein
MIITLITQRRIGFESVLGASGWHNSMLFWLRKNLQCYRKEIVA